MRVSSVTSLLRPTAWLVFLLAFVWPTVALIGQCVWLENLAPGGAAFTARPMLLLGRSFWLAGSATVVCLVVSLPAAYAVGLLWNRAKHAWTIALVAAVLVCPPMIHAFAWDRLLPTTLDPRIRCVGVWALWAWPIPAMLLGARWSRAARSDHEAAMLSASPLATAMHISLPLLLPHVVLSALILFVLFFGDYGVPHACGLIVYSTELLGWAASSSRVMDVAWRAIPSVLVTFAAFALAAFVWRRASSDEWSDTSPPPPARCVRRGVLILLTWFAVSWVVPITALTADIASPVVLVEAVQVYGRDLAWSLAVTGASGAAAAGVGLLITMRTRVGGLALTWALLMGTVPGALIGMSLIAAYGGRGFSWVYDHWPIVALAYIARFGWIGIAAGWIIHRRVDPLLAAQASTDGATRAGLVRHLLIPTNGATLVWGAGVVTALSLADVAASSLVRVPSFAPIAHILIEKFHRFEDGMLISLSLWLIAATLPAVALSASAFRWRVRMSHTPTPR